MTEESRAIIHWGGATFAFRFVAPPRAIPASFFKSLDLQYLNMLLLSMFFHVALVVTLLVYPYDTESLREDLFSQPDRFAKLVLEPQKETQATQNMLEKLKKKTEEEKKEMEKKVEEPKEKQKLKVPDKVQIAKKPVPTKEEKEARVREKFSRMFSGSGGGGMGAILGGGGGGSLSGTLSNVIGTTGRGSATAGLAGLGIRGGALTGGGIGTSRGIAGMGTAGRLGGGGLGYGSGVNLGARRDRNLIGFSTPVVMGALDKEVIQRVIDQHKNQIRYCYEVELQRKQDLEGKVALKWVIAATGAVAKVIVTETTINNKNVEECIKSKVKTWIFPAPAGGGIVEVNYPFVFRATG
jgi:outer membrane biosynthesis protein TonB